MCQSRSHGHHHEHHHHSHSDRTHVPAHDDPAESSRLTRRQALGRLKTAGLAAAASGLPWGSVVRAVGRQRTGCRGRRGPGQALRPQEGRTRHLRRDREADRHAELQRGGHRQPRPRPGRGHPLETLGGEGPDPADPRRDHRPPRPLRGRQPPPRRPRHGERGLSRGLRRQCRGDLLGEDARVAREARRAPDEGDARRPAQADRRSPRQAGGEPRRVRARRPRRPHRGARGVSAGDDARPA